MRARGGRRKCLCCGFVEGAWDSSQIVKSESEKQKQKKWNLLFLTPKKSLPDVF